MACKANHFEELWVEEWLSPALQVHEARLLKRMSELVVRFDGHVSFLRQATEEMGLTIPVKIALDSVGHMDTIVAGTFALEQCQECGECVLNGPCGGSENGKCEVDRDRDCPWILIYERLRALGELDSLRGYKEPKDYAKANKPRSLKLA